MKKITQALGKVALFVVLGVLITPQAFAYDYTYGGSDYGYVDSAPTYTYGGSDYGYSYDPVSYMYGGSDYGYTYNVPSYTYGGSDYGYTYQPTNYTYGGSDYGYTYNTPSYTYGGSDHGYVYTPTSNPVVVDTYVPYVDTFAYGYTSPNYTYNTYPSGYNYGGYNYSYTPSHYSYTPTPYIPGPRYDYKQRPTCTLDASPSTINTNNHEDVELRWTTTNADDVTINNSIGSVSKNGTHLVRPDSNRTYTLHATGPGGSVTCYADVTVRTTTHNNNNVRCDAFNISDSHVDAGDRVTLTWRTSGADRVSIDHGIGTVDQDGDTRVTVRDDTTYTLTARNGSDSDSCTVHVRLNDNNDYHSNNNDIPRCDIYINHTNITRGQSVVFSWNNLRTDRIVINDNHSNIILDSRDDHHVNENQGAITLNPTRSSQYTLIAYNGKTRRTCTVGVNVNDVLVTSTRTQGTIPLNQVPYTGFEAGPVLTFIFYGALALWGVVIGYVLVLKKKAVVATVGAAPALIAPTITGALTHVTPVVTTAVAPATLPVTEMTTMGETHDVMESVDDAVIKELEQHAHDALTLISTDALRFIAAQEGSTADHIATLDRVMTLAKAKYPKDDNWMVLNKERMIALLAQS